MTSTRLITGASHGIGLAMTARCLRAGERVFAVSRDPDRSDALAALAAEAPDRLHPLAADLCDEDAVARLFETVRAHTDTLDALVHCAGLLHDAETGLSPEKRVEDVNLAALQRVFAINGFAPILLARYALPLLRHDRRAVFASLSARVGSIEDNRLGGWYAYRASKAAQNQFLRTFAVEARRRAKNLIVLALHPGTVETGLSAPFRANVPAEKLFSADFAAQCLLRNMENAGEEDSGGFFAWDGLPIPW
ncbi:SDR family NAD(P)-dependent oxidoreductase [Alloalcanivorax venustensis]|uniref:SDR family NAD(P)-dependent oxidoreductase n=1 Tax=Alloalcanivorax venustensis TaxID=172371 RepID=UPI003C44D0DB